jgi:hypothetical protein
LSILESRTVDPSPKTTIFAGQGKWSKVVGVTLIGITVGVGGNHSSPDPAAADKDTPHDPCSRPPVREAGD